ncbi:MAG TPA: hypothetical protein VGP44_05275 [Gemmatimonadales bacterium]|nr:hypothetical protein [Gemmatimonadales bacterium]
MAVYSVTLTHRFYSQRRCSYLMTTKLFAEDAPLAAGALTTAYSRIE